MRGRGDRRAAVPGPGVRHRYRQGGHGGDDPGAIGPGSGATRTFGTTKREVLALADWLRCWQVPAVVMEATGDYWKGPFYRLEAGGLECVLADARQVKNLPGRPKRDPADSRWLAACSRARRGHGLFRSNPGVPGHPAAHPLPAGPDRGADPGEAARGEAAGISRDQDLGRADRPARGDRPGHHGPPDRRGA
jgi:hypothetical protein